MVLIRNRERERERERVVDGDDVVRDLVGVRIIITIEVEKVVAGTPIKQKPVVVVMVVENMVVIGRVPFRGVQRLEGH